MRIANDQLSVEIAERGAELRSIRTADGAEWLWQGDPEFWGGRSPLLFPVVGRSRGNAVSIGGVSYPMTSHGFARAHDFTLEGSGADWARLTLEASEATRTSFPFAFRLTLDYRLASASVNTLASVSNLDSTAMPFQFGFHPGFVWPLPGSAGKPHALVLGNGGEPPCYRLDADKLLLRKPNPSPFVGGRLTPERAQFEDDAMIFPQGAGSAISFAAEGGARLEMRTAGLPNLAIWQKPGAPFLCLEPWRGTAPFADAGDRLEDRNGGASLQPGESMAFHMDIGLTR